MGLYMVRRSVLSGCGRLRDQYSLFTWHVCISLSQLRYVLGTDQKTTHIISCSFTRPTRVPRSSFEVNSCGLPSTAKRKTKIKPTYPVYLGSGVPKEISKLHLRAVSLSVQIFPDRISLYLIRSLPAIRPCSSRSRSNIPGLRAAKLRSVHGRMLPSYCSLLETVLATPSLTHVKVEEDDSCLPGPSPRARRHAPDEQR